MRRLLWVILFSLLLMQARAQTVLFQQDFSSGNTLSSYVDATNPGVNKFTEITGTADKNGTTTVAIANGALEISRLQANLQGGQGRFVRYVDLASPAPGSLYVQFSIDIAPDQNNLWAPGTGIATFSIGNGTTYTNNGTPPENADTFGKLGFSTISTNQVLSWTLRKYVNGNNSNANTFYRGKHLITWVLNNTDYRLTYLKPGTNSGFSTVNAHQWDAWVDDAQLFDEVPATTAGVNLSKFKFIFDGAIGVVRLDDFLFRDVAGALPVTLTNFSGKAQGDQIDLTWTTASERNSALFTIERSTDAQEFQAVGSVRAMGEGDGPHTYSFSDLSPTVGVIYYRLRQTDQDGSTSFSRVLSVRYEPSQPALILLSNPTTADGIRVRTRALESAVYQLHTLSGQQIELATCPQSDDAVWLRPVVGTLPVGFSLLTVQSGTTRLTRRVLIR